MDEPDSKKLLDFFQSRKSVRHFIPSKINRDIINEILEFGRWAPSGKGNEPWRVNVVIHPTVKNMLAGFTEYGSVIESAYVIFVVFLDLDRSYDRVKDLQAIGAFMQNLLLGVHAQKKLGAVWIGEILNQKEKVNELFKINTKKYELMGVIALGEIDEAVEQKDKEKRERRPIEDFTDWY
jgi:nitroreductase